jgi:hypothetical protein
MATARNWAVVTGLIAALAGSSALAAPTGFALAPTQPEFSSLPATNQMTEAQRVSLGRTLMSSELYVAVSASEGGDSGPVSVAARAVVLADGSTAMAVFTSKEKLHQAFGDEASVMTLDGRSALAIYGLGSLILNYGASDQQLWSPDDTRAVLEAGG